MSWTDTQWGDLLMAHMQQPAAGLASGGQSGSRIGNQVTCPSIVALTEMCAGPNIYNATGGNLYLTVDSFATWVWAWEMDNNSSSNTRLWLGEMEGFILLDGPTGEWRRVYFNKQPKGYVNAGSTADPNNPGDQIQVPGTAYASIRPDNNTPLEMWTQPFWPFVDNALMLRMYGFHVRVRAFIIGSDSANAHYMACAGIDPYKANSGLTDSYNPPKGFPSRSTDGGHGTYIEVGTEPMWITGTTVGPTGIVTGSSPPWTANWGSGPNWPWATVGAGRLLSEAQLRANLPPRPYELGGPYLYDHYQPGAAPAPAPAPSPAPAPAPAPAPVPVDAIPAPTTFTNEIVALADPDIAVPASLVGMHLSTHLPTWVSPGGGNAIPAPQYAYGYARNLQAHVNGNEEVCFWSRIELTDGVYTWTDADAWVAAVGSHPIVWMIYGTPTFHQLYTGETSPWPSWSGINSPPDAAGHTALGNFIDALVARYGAKIVAFEIWNEPTLPWTEPATNYTVRWTPALAAAEGLSNVFFSGSGTDLANIAWTVYAHRAGREVLGAAFVDQSGGGDTSLEKFFNAPVTVAGGSGVGKDWITKFSCHFYDYSTTPTNIVGIIAGYRTKLSAASLGSMELWVTEMGAEAGGGFSANDANAPPGILSWLMLCAMLEAKSAILYSHYPTVTYLSDATANQAVIAAIGKAALINGGTITQGGILTGGDVWATWQKGASIYALRSDGTLQVATTSTPQGPSGTIPQVVADANNWFVLDDDSAWEPLREQAVEYISVEQSLIVGVGDTTTFAFSATSNGGYPAPDRTITSVTESPSGFVTTTFDATTNGLGLFNVDITGVTIGAGTMTILADGYSLAFGVSVVLPEDVPGNLLASASAWSRALTR